MDAVTIDEILRGCYLKKYQVVLLGFCALVEFANGATVTLLSFLAPCVGETWPLTNYDKGLLAACVFIGLLLGSMYWGWASDHHGRKVALTASTATIALGGALSAAAPNFWTLVACRVLVGVGGGGLQAVFVLTAELLPARGRGSLLIAVQATWALGAVFVTAAAYILLEMFGWRALAAAAAAPQLLVLAALPLVPESPRWLLKRGETEKAAAIMRKICEVNGIARPPFYLVSGADADGDDATAVPNDAGVVIAVASGGETTGKAAAAAAAAAETSKMLEACNAADAEAGKATGGGMASTPVASTPLATPPPGEGKAFSRRPSSTGSNHGTRQGDGDSDGDTAAGDDGVERGVSRSKPRVVRFSEPCVQSVWEEGCPPPSTANAGGGSGGSGGNGRAPLRTGRMRRSITIEVAPPGSSAVTPRAMSEPRLAALTQKRAVPATVQITVASPPKRAALSSPAPQPKKTLAAPALAAREPSLLGREFLLLTLTQWAIHLAWGAGYYGLVDFIAVIFEAVDGSCSFGYAAIALTAAAELLHLFAVLVVDSLGRRLTLAGLFALTAASLVLMRSSPAALAGGGSDFDARGGDDTGGGGSSGASSDGAGSDGAESDGGGSGGAGMWELIWALVARAAVTGASHVCYLVTPEVYPTALRNTGLAAAVVLAQVGAMGMSFLLSSGASADIAVAVLVAVSVVGVGGAMLMPHETAGKDLDGGSSGSDSAKKAGAVAGGGGDQCGDGSRCPDGSAASNVGLLMSPGRCGGFLGALWTYVRGPLSGPRYQSVPGTPCAPAPEQGRKSFEAWGEDGLPEFARLETDSSPASPLGPRS